MSLGFGPNQTFDWDSVILYNKSLIEKISFSFSCNGNVQSVY